MVKPHDLGTIIDEHPFFNGIDERLRALLIGCAANERYVAGEHLFREGGEARKFYLIRAGTVAVEVEPPVKKAIVLETLGEGDVLGWSWMIPPHRAAFAARAQTAVRALSFDAKCLLRKMEEEPALGYEVLKRFLPVMAHRLSAARMQMLDLYGPAVVEVAEPKKIKKPEKAKKPEKVKKTEKAQKPEKAKKKAS